VRRLHRRPDSGRWRGDIHRQCLRIFCRAGGDRHVIQRDDARQLADVARECPHVVVGAGDLERDGPLSIELAGDFAGRRAKELELQAAAKPRLVDVDEQCVHLRAIGQLAQQRAELRIDLAQLLPV